MNATNLSDLVADATNDNTAYEEYVSSIGYGEGWIDLDLSNITDQDVAEALADLKTAKEYDKLKLIILDCIDVIESDTYIIDNEVFGVVIGEICCDLTNLLTPDELDSVTQEQLEELDGEYFRNNYLVYADRNYERVVAVLNLDAARLALGIGKAV